jgi:hypothetical protein
VALLARPCRSEGGGRLLGGAFLIYWMVEASAGSSGTRSGVAAEKTGLRRASSEFKPSFIVLNLDSIACISRLT